MDQRTFLTELGQLERTIRARDGAGNHHSKECDNCSRCMFCERCTGCHACTYVVGSQGCTHCNHVRASVDCHGCNQLIECTRCVDSTALVRCTDCTDCDACFGCVGLSRKTYYILNEPYSKNDYLRLTAALRVSLGGTGHCASQMNAPVLNGGGGRTLPHTGHLRALPRP